MKIGIKYCGGCNPRYDRVAEINKLKAEFPKAEFVTASLHPDCDIVIVVCGCFSQCADRTGLKAKEHMYITWQVTDFDQIRERLREEYPDWKDVVVNHDAVTTVGFTKTEETIAFEASQAEAVAKAKKTEQEEASKWMKMVMPLSGK